jgi:hypothetical protein
MWLADDRYLPAGDICFEHPASPIVQALDRVVEAQVTSRRFHQR